MRLSNSRIQCFKSCRRKYELKYVENIVPVQSAEALERGKSYHEKVEMILKGEEFTFDDPKTDAMALAFQKHIMPQIGKIEAVEEWFERPLPDGNVLCGKCDGRLADGKILEHKTTSADLDEAYIASLQNDEQILTYMWAYGVNEILYTVCKTPTIRIKKDESEDDFRQRCLEWYDTDTPLKIGTIDVFRMPDEIKEFGADLEAISDEINHCKRFYRVPSHCMKWGRPCEYMGICRNFDPQMEYIGFERRKEYEAE
jgi:hypothetical protein